VSKRSPGHSTSPAVPAERNGQPSSACKFVLAGLANHAGPDGTSAFPSVRTLTRYTGLSERTVRTYLDRLETADVIIPCDPEVVAAKIKRADRRPQGRDLNLTLIRTDLGDAEPQSPENQFPGLQARLAAAGPAADGPPPRRVQPLHPAAGTGCNQRPGGGAAAAPEPSGEPSTKPPAVPAADHGSASAPTRPGGGAAAGFFAALGPEWKLTDAQRLRLSPAIATAAGTGWALRELAGWAGANTAGIRNPCAVLASRLAPAELPPRQPGIRPARPGAACATSGPGADPATRLRHRHAAPVPAASGRAARLMTAGRCPQRPGRLRDPGPRRPAARRETQLPVRPAGREHAPEPRQT
jgi:hypothetical protein